jgi:hypothetical protein
MSTQNHADVARHHNFHTHTRHISSGKKNHTFNPVIDTTMLQRVCITTSLTVLDRLLGTCQHHPLESRDAVFDSSAEDRLVSADQSGPADDL